jgi:hypothetical protein
MTESVIKKFMDNKISSADSTIEIVPFLLERIQKSRDKIDQISNETAIRTQSRIIDFSLKRIDQILTIRSNEEFSKFNPVKLLKLIHLIDKLNDDKVPYKNTLLLENHLPFSS